MEAIVTLSSPLFNPALVLLSFYSSEIKQPLEHLRSDKSMTLLSLPLSLLPSRLSLPSPPHRPPVTSDPPNS